MNKPLCIVQILWNINGNTSYACMNFVLGLQKLALLSHSTSVIIAF